MISERNKFSIENVVPFIILSYGSLKLTLRFPIGPDLVLKFHTFLKGEKEGRGGRGRGRAFISLSRTDHKNYHFEIKVIAHRYRIEALLKRH